MKINFRILFFLTPLSLPLFWHITFLYIYLSFPLTSYHRIDIYYILLQVYLATITTDVVLVLTMVIVQYRMTNHKLQILYNILLFSNEWADDFVSAIVLWFECFIAAGLSPTHIKRKESEISWNLCMVMVSEWVSEWVREVVENMGCKK